MAHSFNPSSLTDVKIFILFLLDSIRGPIDYTALSGIIAENAYENTFDYIEALKELADSGHLLFDEFDKEQYYMISDSGRAVSHELYDLLPVGIREEITESVARYVRITNDGIKIKCDVADGDGHYLLKLKASDKDGEFISVELKVPSKQEALRMKANFENNPSGIYRGFLFSLTGRLEFLS